MTDANTWNTTSTAKPATAGTPLLEVEGLHAGYGPVRVLHGLDLIVPEGQVAVILGANGAGKTTTLRAISGMVKATGSIRLEGVELLGMGSHHIARAGVGHVPQGRGTFADLTVDENLRLGAIAHKGPEVEADLDRWYGAFPRLGERRDQVSGSMSGGEQQMLAIARALMGRPRLLLLDEPSLGLAPLITRELFDRLGQINKEEGLTMLVVEQNATLALGIGDVGYVLETGSIVTSGSAQELEEHDEVRQAYLGF
jgi:branched-chain amino acid transport system ATP-binding protein